MRRVHIVLFVGMVSAVLLGKVADAIPLGTAFTYQGQLKQDGAPVSGLCDFQFSPWNALSGGSQVGGTVSALAIPVVNGLFEAQIDFGAASFPGEARWLEVAVRCPNGVGEFNSLSPREPLTATPYALQTRGIFVNDALKVGIGTVVPSHALTIGSADQETLRLIGPVGAYGWGARLNFGDGDLAFLEEDSDDNLNFRADRFSFSEGRVGIGIAAPAARIDVLSSGETAVRATTNWIGVYGLHQGDGSFLTLFLGIELLSLPVYVLVLLAFRRPQSAEAALKYLVLGGAASATLLMGASLLLGWSGSLGLVAFAEAVRSTDPFAIAGAVLVLVAFFLKAAVAPFHTWAPDAYEGASVPVTAFMATIVKAAVLLAAVRLFGGGPVSEPFVLLLAVLPLVSIAWGNLAAMRQAGLRRMIAYSSIAHAGYLFYAFLGAGPTRFEAVAFYLVAYGAMNLLAFASLPPDADDAARDRLDNLKGLFHRRPYAAIAIAIAMLSLAGLPPFPGFIAKFLIFRNVIANGHTLYAVLGLIGSYMGIYFYLRVVQYMFMSEARAEARAGLGTLAIGAGAICLVAGIVMSILPGWVLAQL